MKYPAGDTLVDVYETLKIKTDINTNDKFYTCRNDRTFKEVLLNEKNEEILKKIIYIEEI